MTSISSSIEDNVLYFEGGDYVNVPVSTLNSLDSAVTITLWQYGSSLQPQNDVIFAAYSEEGNRILNVHLPWSNGRVYWDAGYDGGYDRIDKAANPENYMGRWNHWAFVKDVYAETMTIYLNGLPWHFGNFKARDLTGIASFSIGGSTNGGSNYDGKVDEFRVWNTVLDQETIENWMYRDIDPGHPNYSNLLAYFQFDEGAGHMTQDASTFGVTAQVLGY